jgi:hypothetical protein
MSSTLHLDGNDVDIEQYAALVTVTQARPSRWSFSASLGTIVDGTLETAGMRHDIAPGIVGSFGTSRGWLSGPWFVTGSMSLGVSRVTAGPALVAVDGRIGAVAGRRVGPVGAYALARAFGGPVLWQIDGTDVAGGDAHHYQLGVGANAARGSWSVVLDLAVVGERGASLGVARQL